MKTLFAQTTLSDLSPHMLQVSRELNPDCEHVQGDMRTLRLGRTFDVVFIHDAIDYMTTPQALREAIETASVHCKPGGVAILTPDYIRETFKESAEQDGHDDADRALRYIEWTYDPDPSDTMYTTDFVYLLREGTQPVRVLHDPHICGLFSREEWREWMRESGFEVEIVPDPFGRELFVGRQPT